MPRIQMLAICAALAATSVHAQPRQARTNQKPVAIPAPGFQGDRPVGLFYRLKVDFSSGNRLDVYTIAFLPGSRVTRTYPYGGAETFDQERRCNPDMCGSYQVTGDAIAIRWDNGQTSHWSYRRTDDGFELDGDSYKPIRTFTRATLVGSWSGAATPTNASQNSYTLNLDATFTFSVDPVRPGLGGRYSLSGTTLTLDWADGTTQRRTLFGGGSNTPISLASIEGDTYRRR
jgi:hypothetical protein